MTVEEILDRAWQDEGVTLQELYTSKQIARIEARFLAAGYAMETLYKEWASKTTDQIIAEYSDKIPVPIESTKPITMTDWMPVTFMGMALRSGLEMYGQYAVLQTNVLLQGTNSHDRTFEVSLNEKEIANFNALNSGEQIEVRLSLEFELGRIHAHLLDFRCACREMSAPPASSGDVQS